MRSLSICTPWLNLPFLIPDYERAVRGADQVIVIDNGSSEPNAAAIAEMVARLGGVLIRREDNGWFSGPANEGLAVATGDVVVVLNNDIRCADPDWLERVRRDVEPGGLYGPSSGTRMVDGVHIPYIEGWCVAAARTTWQRLSGFDAATFERPYWEDVDLSFRAMILGIGLYRSAWQVEHLSNTTSAVTPGAYDASEANRLSFEAKVRQQLGRRAAA